MVVNMAVRTSKGMAWSPESVNKKTSIGFKNIKTSTMNKSQKRNHKKYRGQGK